MARPKIECLKIELLVLSYLKDNGFKTVDDIIIEIKYSKGKQNVHRVLVDLYHQQKVYYKKEGSLKFWSIL
jgi:hypothetical protein